jgi:hypothetical protein
MYRGPEDIALTVALYTGGALLTYCMCVMADAAALTTSGLVVLTLYLGAKADGLI